MLESKEESEQRLAVIIVGLVLFAYLIYIYGYLSFPTIILINLLGALLVVLMC